VASGNDYIGEQTGNYRLIEELDSGGFGDVYRCEHIHIPDRMVAVKFLHTRLRSQEERAQFLQEARLLAKLKHNHILPFIDFGFSKEIKDAPYLMTEYAPGGSLRDRLKKHKPPRPLSEAEALSILSQVGQALHYAHQQNIIHRDLKPDNILFNAQGRVLLADFGIATVLSTASVKQTTSIIGTPPYMAPEQFKGTISKESDQYALGCIAYELFTGRPPFTAPDFYSMAFKHLTDTPSPPTQLNPGLPVHIEQAILRAMAKERTDRYPDIAAFIEALSAPPPEVTSKTKEQWLTESFSLYEARRYEEARKACEHALQLDPKFAYAHNTKGLAFYSLKRYTEALNALEQAIQFSPNEPTAHYGKGRVLERLQRYQEALQAYEQVIRLDSGYEEARVDKANVLKRLGRSG